MKHVAKSAHRVKLTEINMPNGVKWTFVGALAAGWLAELMMLVLLFTGPGVYIGAGTWTIQITMWLFPVLMVALGLVFAWRHYGHLVDRLFMAVVLAAAAMSVYGACSSMFHALQTHYQWFTPNMNDTSLWNAFGAEWVLMLVCAALFAATLGLFEARWLKRR